MAAAGRDRAQRELVPVPVLDEGAARPPDTVPDAHDEAVGRARAGDRLQDRCGRGRASLVPPFSTPMAVQAAVEV